MHNIHLNKKATYYKTIKVANPDTTYPNCIYMLKINNTFYWGELVKKDSNSNIKTNTKVGDQWFQAIPSNIPNTIELYPCESMSKYEHPYEELAYEISKNLVK